jgi:hypothetical protein
MGELLRLGSREVAGSFYWFQDQSNRFVAHNDLYVQDIDDDGAEEIFLRDLKLSLIPQQSIQTSALPFLVGLLDS